MTILEKFLFTLDVVVRRKSRLGKLRWLRKMLLVPYRRLINLQGRGILMNIAGCIPARMPADLAWKLVEDYEKDSLAVMNQWLKSQNNPLVVDIGCALGFVSCAALFGNPHSQVVAIDSDLQSIKASQRLCALAHDVDRRLKFVWGFVSDTPTLKCDYLQAHEATLVALNRPGISGDPGSTHYTCLDDESDATRSIARFTLDDLFGPDHPKSCPILIKCDVEGAELLVLKGGERILTEMKPVLLLSVHPQLLPKYGSTTDDVRAFLDDKGYKIDVVSVDHEEHWWCVTG